MDLWKTIVEFYPELTNDNFGPQGNIRLQDDSDGQGAYILKWDYLKPLPKGLKVGK